MDNCKVVQIMSIDEENTIIEISVDGNKKYFETTLANGEKSYSYEFVKNGNVYLSAYNKTTESWITMNMGSSETDSLKFELFDFKNFVYKDGWYVFKDSAQESVVQKYFSEFGTMDTIEFAMKFKHENKHFTELSINNKYMGMTVISELNFSDFGKIEIIIPDEVWNSQVSESTSSLTLVSVILHSILN